MKTFSTTDPGKLGLSISPIDAELRTYVRGFLTPFVPGILVGLAVVVAALAGFSN